jgi:hypothetical protein
VLENGGIKLGDAVIVTWNKSDESAYGGAEGVVFGITGDKIAGECLIIDGSTYDASFKSALSLLNIFDFRVIPVSEIVSIKKTGLRKRPPGATESFKLKMEANYISNIDFEATVAKLQSRTDCNVAPMLNSKSGAEYGKTIKKIETLKGATVNILNTRALHIYCYYDALENVLKWIAEAFELLRGHKRLVLFPKKVMYTVHDSHKEHLRPETELLYRIATSEKGEPVVFPLGWAHWLFSELDANPLQELFPKGQPIEKLVFDSRKKKKNELPPLNSFVEEDSKKSVKLRFPWGKTKPNKYLGADAPLIRMTGFVETPEQAEELMNRWLGSHSDVWTWFKSKPFRGKAIIRDLSINRKTGVYIVDIRKYSGNEF